MAHRSNFLKNLEIFYQTGLVFLPNNTYNDKTKQLFPKQPPFRLPEIKLPPNFLLLYPHPIFTPILFKMTQKYPLKLGGRTVDLYKLIQTVRNFVNQVCKESQNSEKKNEKMKASETSDILSKTTTWKKVSEILFSESTAGPSCSSPKITVFPPSLLNKLRLIYQKYIQPFEEAHLKAKLEIIRQNRPNIADNGFPENLNLNHPRLTAIDLYLNSDSNSKSRTFDTHRESTSKRKSKYLDYIEGEEEFLELSKDEIDEHGQSILDKKKGNPDLDFLTPDRKKDNDEDDEFKWRPQITASARRNRSSFLNTNDDSNDAGPNTPVSPYPPKIDRSKLKPYRLNSSSKIPNFFQLINSLESGLANERDFAINTLALLSYVNNNAPMTQLYTCNQLKLYKIREANNLIDSLLRHIGIEIEDSTSDFREICTFWAVLLKKRIKQMEDQDETDDMNLKFFQENKFPVSDDDNEEILPRLKYEEIILRFNTIFDILRNISFDSQNAEILWQNNNFRRFLYICLQTEQYDYNLFSGSKNGGKDIGGSTLSRTRSNFVVVGLDIFENISRVIVLNKLSIYEKTFWLEVLFMWPERTREITAVDTKLSREFYLRIILSTSNLSTMSLDNRILIEQNLTKRYIALLLFQLTIPDVEIVVHTLELIHNLTNLSDKCIKLMLSCKNSGISSPPTGRESSSFTPILQQNSISRNLTPLPVASSSLDLTLSKASSLNKNNNNNNQELQTNLSTINNDPSSICPIELLISLLSNNIRSHPQHVLSMVILRQPVKQPTAVKNKDHSRERKQIPIKSAVHDSRPAMPEAVFHVPKIKVQKNKRKREEHKSDEKKPKIEENIRKEKTPTPVPSNNARTVISPKPKLNGHTAEKLSTTAIITNNKIDRLAPNTFIKNSKIQNNTSLKSDYEDLKKLKAKLKEKMLADNYENPDSPFNFTHQNGIMTSSFQMEIDEDSRNSVNSKDSSQIPVQFQINGHHSPKEKLATHNTNNNRTMQNPTVNGFIRPNMNGNPRILNGHMNGSVLTENHGRNKSNSGEGSNISSNMSSNSTLTIDKNTSDNDETLILEDQPSNPVNPANQTQNNSITAEQNDSNVTTTTTTKNEPTINSNSNNSSHNASFDKNDNLDREVLSVSDEEIELQGDSESSSSDEDLHEGIRPDRIPTPPRLYLKDPLDAKSGRQVLINQNSKINITDFTDWLDGEDAISKHIHLTAALIILNIVGFCVIANDRKPIKKILKHRELLARLAFSKMDCASQISKLLFEADKAKSITGNANFKK